MVNMEDCPVHRNEQNPIYPWTCDCAPGTLFGLVECPEGCGIFFDTNDTDSPIWEGWCPECGYAVEDV